MMTVATLSPLLSRRWLLTAHPWRNWATRTTPPRWKPPPSSRVASAACIVMAPATKPLLSTPVKRTTRRRSVLLEPQPNHRCCLQRAHCYHELAYQRTGPDVGEVLQYRQGNEEEGGRLTLTTSPPSTVALLLDPPDNVHAAAASASSSSPLVRVQMRYAPWNPADMNAVQGLYPLPQSPEVVKVRQSSLANNGSSNNDPSAPPFTVAGSEGLGQVSQLLSTPEEPTSSTLQVGDYVTLAYPSMGTMRSSIVVPDRMLIKVDRGHELVNHLHGDDSAAAASCLFQMGGTALRMLSDFVPVLATNHSDDDDDAAAAVGSRVVVQNAGNSAVGFMASQIAAIHGAHPVSLIRRGTRTPAQLDELIHFLKEVGRNSIVAVEEDLHQDREATRRLKDSLRELSNDGSSLPLLALNAVGGSSCSLLFKLLGGGGGGSGGEGATLVTYGGMSRKPVPVSTAQLIFDDVRVRGYWQSRWMSQQKSHMAKHRLVNDLTDLVLDRGLRCPPVQVFSLADFSRALAFEASQSGQSVRRKVVFNCQED